MHSVNAIGWAEGVSDGSIIQCQHVINACNRFLKDYDNQGKYIYSPEKADAVCRWIEKLPHVKGKWAGRKQYLELEPWQCFIVCNIFGWLNAVTGKRRFRDVYAEIPRKNGKSFLAAAIGLYMFCADGEHGAEVYSGATTEKQAFEVFKPARMIVLNEPDLKSHFDISAQIKNLAIISDGSKFEPLIGKPGDGSSPSCAIVDEYHEHASSDLVDTMSTGMGAREQPLLLTITTAGTDFGGPCREKREDCIRVLDGTFEDDTQFAIVFGIDEGDDWDTEAALEKANPNIDVSVSREYLLAELGKAKRSATKQNAYKTKHLNQWVGAKVSWLNMLELQLCKKPNINIENFKGRECYIGVDLATKRDVACIAMLFPEGDKFTAFVHHYLPYSAVYEEAKNHRYKGWGESGLLNVTDGNVTDIDTIEDDIREACADFTVKEIAFDPWQASQMANHLVAERLPMIEVRPVVQNFSEPMKELEAIIAQRRFEYDGDPVLTWMFGNVLAKADKKDNIFPDKQKPENKIDGVVAIIMAMNRVISSQKKGDSEGYFDSGPMVLG